MSPAVTPLGVPERTTVVEVIKTIVKFCRAPVAPATIETRSPVTRQSVGVG